MSGRIKRRKKRRRTEEEEAQIKRVDLEPWRHGRVVNGTTGEQRSNCTHTK